MSEPNPDANSDPDTPEQLVPGNAETEWEALIRAMGRLKADITRLETLPQRHDDVPRDIAGQLSLIASEYNNLIEDIVRYEEGGDLPDECPVCGDKVVSADALEPDETYDVEKVCIREKTAGGPGHGIIHFATDDD